MKIAVLGWGSLIWDDDSNGDFTKYLQFTKWGEDGPNIPVEYLRESQKNVRYTLVIDETALETAVMWNVFNQEKVKTLEEAVSLLKKREGTKTNWIGWYNRQTFTMRSENLGIVGSTIANWAAEKKVDGVVWTDIQSNLVLDEKNLESIRKKILKKVQERPDRKEAIKKYILETPNQIHTRFKEELQDFVRTEL